MKPDGVYPYRPPVTGTILSREEERRNHVQAIKNPTGFAPNLTPMVNGVWTNLYDSDNADPFSLLPRNNFGNQQIDAKIAFNLSNGVLMNQWATRLVITRRKAAKAENAVVDTDEVHQQHQNEPSMAVAASSEENFNIKIPIDDDSVNGPIVRVRVDFYGINGGGQVTFNRDRTWITHYNFDIERHGFLEPGGAIMYSGINNQAGGGQQFSVTGVMHSETVPAFELARNVSTRPNSGNSFELSLAEVWLAKSGNYGIKFVEPISKTTLSQVIIEKNLTEGNVAAGFGDFLKGVLNAAPAIGTAIGGFLGNPMLGAQIGGMAKTVGNTFFGSGLEALNEASGIEKMEKYPFFYGSSEEESDEDEVGVPEWFTNQEIYDEYPYKVTRYGEFPPKSIMLPLLKRDYVNGGYTATPYMVTNIKWIRDDQWDDKVLWKVYRPKYQYHHCYNCYGYIPLEKVNHKFMAPPYRDPFAQLRVMDKSTEKPPTNTASGLEDEDWDDLFKDLQPAPAGSIITENEAAVIEDPNNPGFLALRNMKILLQIDPKEIKFDEKNLMRFAGTPIGLQMSQARLTNLLEAQQVGVGAVNFPIAGANDQLVKIVSAKGLFNPMYPESHTYYVGVNDQTYGKWFAVIQTPFKLETLLFQAVIQAQMCAGVQTATYVLAPQQANMLDVTLGGTSSGLATYLSILGCITSNDVSFTGTVLSNGDLTTATKLDKKAKLSKVLIVPMPTPACTNLHRADIPSEGIVGIDSTGAAILVAKAFFKGFKRTLLTPAVVEVEQQQRKSLGGGSVTVQNVVLSAQKAAAQTNLTMLEKIGDQEYATPGKAVPWKIIGALHGLLHDPYKLDTALESMYPPHEYSTYRIAFKDGKETKNYAPIEGIIIALGKNMEGGYSDNKYGKLKGLMEQLRVTLLGNKLFNDKRREKQANIAPQLPKKKEGLDMNLLSQFVQNIKVKAPAPKPVEMVNVPQTTPSQPKISNPPGGNNNAVNDDDLDDAWNG
jgi:hypothetical protein